jgi:hypothetical protein
MMPVQKWRLLGRTKRAVRRVESGKRKRVFFDSKKAADRIPELLEEVAPYPLVARINGADKFSRRQL